MFKVNCTNASLVISLLTFLMHQAVLEKKILFSLYNTFIEKNTQQF